MLSHSHKVNKASQIPLDCPIPIIKTPGLRGSGRAPRIFAQLHRNRARFWARAAIHEVAPRGHLIAGMFVENVRFSPSSGRRLARATRFLSQNRETLMNRGHQVVDSHARPDKIEVAAQSRISTVVNVFCC